MTAALKLFVEEPEKPGGFYGDPARDQHDDPLLFPAPALDEPRPRLVEVRVVRAAPVLDDEFWLAHGFGS